MVVRLNNILYDVLDFGQDGSRQVSNGVRFTPLHFSIGVEYEVLNKKHSVTIRRSNL